MRAGLVSLGSAFGRIGRDKIYLKCFECVRHFKVDNYYFYLAAGGAAVEGFDIFRGLLSGLFFVFVDARTVSASTQGRNNYGLAT